MRGTVMIPTRTLVVALATCSLAAPALAGGLARPNPVSARGVGMGAAFTAIADDPTALHYNPAGLANLPRSAVLLGAELVRAPRTYEPDPTLDACQTDPSVEVCQDQSPTSPVRPVPVLGFASRLHRDGIPSRLAFGVGFWNTYGGQLEFPRFENQAIGAINETQNVTLEIVPGVAYEVNDVLALGLAFRVGVGLFKSNTTAKPSSADLSASGVGAGATVGIMVRPSKRLSIGGVYRTSMTNKLNGEGQLMTPAILDVDVKISQRWPQSAAFGIAYWLTDSLRVSGQVDWVGWSFLNELNVTFPGQEGMNQTFILDFDDNYAVHAGAEFLANDALALRAGWTFDSQAVPDETIERQFLDSNKMLGAVGASYHVTDNWRIDTAIETSIPTGKRTVPNNGDDLAGWFNAPLGGVSPATRANPAPGEHSGTLTTLQLAVQYLY